MTGHPAARVVERGYRRYDGPRRSGGAPIVSLAIHSAQRALGVRRSAATKILPILSVVFAYLPAAAFVGAVALLPQPLRRAIPGYEAYYGFITAAIFLFAALVSPELLCADRRTGMLGLYLTSPLTAWRYLAAKAAALTAILAIVTLGPPLLLTVAYALQGVGPNGPGELGLTLVRIVAAGITLAGVYGAASLAVSSLTDRRAFASAGIILLIFVPNVVTAVLVQAFELPRWVTLFTLTDVPFELVQRTYGRPGTQPDVPTIAVLGLWLAIVAVAVAVVVWRYRPERRRTAAP